jgi:hypothetical protein
MDRNCKKCGTYIPTVVKIDGKRRNLQNRVFCLQCSPFGSHNTRDITTPRQERLKRKGAGGANSLAVMKYRRRLKFRLMEYKGSICQMCGYDKPIPRAYGFHHRDPAEKEFEIARSLCKSFETLRKEVDKCDLLCCRCHAEVHHELDSA